jgi:hypothetical protein
MSDNLFNTGTSTSDKTGPIIDLGTTSPGAPLNPAVPQDGTFTVEELQKALDGKDYAAKIEKGLHF